jgi:carbon monoxide dehydrogenase subunit G
MADFVSEVKTIPYSDKDIYTVLSDLNNLELVKDRIPQDKIKEFSFDSDSCTISVDPVGNVRFVIIEREPNSTIKFEAEQIPFAVNMWIQLKASGEAETKMKLTVRAELNPFIKPMVSKPLQQGLDKMAEVLATIPYDQILNQGTIE